MVKHYSPLVYRALLTQVATGAPSAIILENTLGGVPTFIRDDEGLYIVELQGAWRAGKTAVTGITRNQQMSVDMNEFNADRFYFNTVTDDALNGNFFQILVYS